MYPVTMGAYTQLWGATTADLEESDSGCHLIPWARKCEDPDKLLHPKAMDEDLAKEVWDWLEMEYQRICEDANANVGEKT